MGFASYLEDIAKVLTANKYRGSSSPSNRKPWIKPGPDRYEDYWSTVEKLCREVLKVIHRAVQAEEHLHVLRHQVEEEIGVTRIAVAKYGINLIDLEIGSGDLIEDWVPPRNAERGELRRRIDQDLKSLERRAAFFREAHGDVHKGLDVI